MAKKIGFGIKKIENGWLLQEYSGYLGTGDRYFEKYDALCEYLAKRLKRLSWR